jgi:pyruvate dehydrogenase E1 component
VFIDGFVHQLPDVDPQETEEWLDSLDSVIDIGGRARARYLLARLMERAREQGVGVPAMVSTDYINTIPREQEPWFPGDELLERRIRAYIRWNAMAMVDRSNHRFDALGGHLSTFASAAALYDVGFNHFFRGKSDGGRGDQIFFQGHAAPGIYARAFLEGRLSVDQLDRKTAAADEEKSIGSALGDDESALVDEEGDGGRHRGAPSSPGRGGGARAPVAGPAHRR